MTIDDQTCNNCGSTEFKQIVSTSYPERRQERDRTVKNVYDCAECGKQGKHFEHKDGGPDTYSGVFR